MGASLYIICQRIPLVFLKEKAKAVPRHGLELAVRHWQPALENPGRLKMHIEAVELSLFTNLSVWGSHRSLLITLMSDDRRVITNSKSSLRTKIVPDPNFTFISISGVLSFKFFIRPLNPPPAFSTSRALPPQLAAYRKSLPIKVFKLSSIRLRAIAARPGRLSREAEKSRSGSKTKIPPSTYMDKYSSYVTRERLAVFARRHRREGSAAVGRARAKCEKKPGGKSARILGRMHWVRLRGSHEARLKPLHVFQWVFCRYLRILLENIARARRLGVLVHQPPAQGSDCDIYFSIKC
ncbi:hypothetical protein EVAR_55457_1 [Eumeta japonica]|uniref:Uncharacterized protein n=1 Tax=Eumeta variegata TaxID=151549 RepID=A0A4C1Y6F7_EUMVA|nr:hypothetical protein EVAR_55457_1 [Eumeta japonica]